jgi:hypothetical protein
VNKGTTPREWWGKVDRLLAHQCGFTPEQIDQLTLTEIYLLVEDDSAKSNWAAADLAEYVRWFNSLSYTERLYAERY